MLEWIENRYHDLAALKTVNQQKAALLYDQIDQSRLFTNPVRPEDRSIMNVPFVTGCLLYTSAAGAVVPGNNAAHDLILILAQQLQQRVKIHQAQYSLQAMEVLVLPVDSVCLLYTSM